LFARADREELAPGACVLRGLALADDGELKRAVDAVAAEAPFRHMVTPGGFLMSVAVTNCGSLGWVTDRKGYRYDTIDPKSGLAWPQMPDVFSELATRVSAQAGFAGYLPDACLINRYLPGARVSLHQDKNEQDFNQPIVSVSLGIPAVFLFGGLNRADRAMRLKLTHGDVVVWGGPARLRYHGILPVKEDYHALVGNHRINLTFRKAG
jgi:alkylated DNA repair protein (DNA oxidative demethylase)